mmetsp:Transcript_33031/g.76119  ORF Transcript_33031/g.76119 Transcript_33031/m.76119 type:complete len:326 (-) Transcript_33031:206-1183(-)
MHAGGHPSQRHRHRDARRGVLFLRILRVSRFRLRSPEAAVGGGAQSQRAERSAQGTGGGRVLGASRRRAGRDDEKNDQSSGQDPARRLRRHLRRKMLVRCRRRRSLLPQLAADGGKQGRRPASLEHGRRLRQQMVRPDLHPHPPRHLQISPHHASLHRTPHGRRDRNPLPAPGGGRPLHHGHDSGHGGDPLRRRLLGRGALGGAARWSLRPARRGGPVRGVSQELDAQEKNRIGGAERHQRDASEAVRGGAGGVQRKRRCGQKRRCGEGGSDGGRCGGGRRCGETFRQDSAEMDDHEGRVSHSCRNRPRRVVHVRAKDRLGTLWR